MRPPIEGMVCPCSLKTADYMMKTVVFHRNKQPLNEPPPTWQGTYATPSCMLPSHLQTPFLLTQKCRLQMFPGFLGLVHFSFMLSHFLPSQVYSRQLKLSFYEA